MLMLHLRSHLTLIRFRDDSEATYFLLRHPA